MLNKIYSKIEEYVISFFESNSKPELTYHNLDHTITVVKRTREIAAHYRLTASDKLVLHAAAWFHDTGYLVDSVFGHEERSVAIMKSFLEQELIETQIIQMISSCIMATKYPPHPETLFEQIICDADTYHFGTDEFWETDPLVKKEVESILGLRIPNWSSQALLLLKHHKFFTEYCRNLLAAGKQKNIQQLEARIKMNKED